MTFRDAERLNNRLWKTQEIVDRALRTQLDWNGGNFSESRYASYRQAVKIRISNHVAPHGAGWCESRQQRYNEPDVNLIIAPRKQPSVAEIRARVAGALRRLRKDGAI